MEASVRTAVQSLNIQSPATVISSQDTPWLLLLPDIASPLSSTREERIPMILHVALLSLDHQLLQHTNNTLPPTTTIPNIRVVTSYKTSSPPPSPIPQIHTHPTHNRNVGLLLQHPVKVFSPEC